MASFADLRPIIVIICFTSFFALFLNGFYLGGSTPADLLTLASPTQLKYPTFLDTFYTNQTLTFIAINWSETWTDTGTLANGTIQAKLYSRIVVDPEIGQVFQVDTFKTAWFGLFSYETDFEHLIWYTNDSMTEQVSAYGYIGAAEYHGIWNVTLDGWYAYYGNISALRFYVRNSRVSTYAQFAFNETLYSSPSDAWSHDKLYVAFENGYSTTPQPTSTINTIASLLTWSLPGVPYWVFLLVSMAIAGPIAYIAAIWILRLLGSIAGGGGSG